MSLSVILPTEFYQHHLLLIEGIYLLLKDNVTKSDIAQSTRLLRHYGFMFGALYGMLIILAKHGVLTYYLYVCM